MPVSTLRLDSCRDVQQGTARQRTTWKGTTATKFGDGHEAILFFFLLLRVLLSEDLSCQAARQKRAGRWPRLTAGRIEWQFPSGCLHGRLSWRSRRLQARGWHYMNECAAVCRQTGRWASIEGGRCRSDCSVLPHVVPETARSSSAGLVQPVGSGQRASSRCS